MGKLKLFCIPYAGGSATIYNSWTKFINPDIEICPIELPGRGKRFGEGLKSNMNDMVEDVFNSVKDKIQSEPYAFFGYSMGSIISYEVIRKINRLGLTGPIHSFFAARQAPHINKNIKNIYLLNEQAFIEEILKLGGTSKEVFENNELRAIFSNILRNDYQIVETYRHNRENEKLECDITVLYGSEDSYDCEDIKQWAEVTNKQYTFHEFCGGHFFINDYLKEIVEIVNKDTKKYIIR